MNDKMNAVASRIEFLKPVDLEEQERGIFEMSSGYGGNVWDVKGTPIYKYESPFCSGVIMKPVNGVYQCACICHTAQHRYDRVGEKVSSEKNTAMGAVITSMLFDFINSSNDGVQSTTSDVTMLKSVLKQMNGEN